MKALLGTILMTGTTIYWGLIYRFANPHLTETQLFLAKWWLIFPVALGIFLCWLDQRD